MKLRLLGCGTSSGVPRIGADWGRCDPDEPRNWRMRTAGLVSTGRTRVLVDTGPDMRRQLIDARVASVDAVIWTHAHADHVHGIDDLRQLFHNSGAPVRCFARAATIEDLRARFAYVFHGRAGYPPVATLDPLPDRMEIGDLVVTTVDQPHGAITSAGLCFAHEGKRIGYSTDFSGMTDDMRRAFDGIDVWAVDALRREPHPTHPTLDQVVAWVSELGVRHAALIHMDNSMDYRTLCAELPEHIRPGHDGMELIP